MTDSAKTKNGKASVKRKVSKAIDSSREQTSRRVEDNPLAVLGAGIAVGMIAGALLPKTQREKSVLGPLGKRITATAGAAVAAAREVGKQELSALTPDTSRAKARAGSIVEHVLLAAKEAGRDAAKKSG
ncbi:hypothetical protein NYR55_02465 [Sphingomonas sp. BGYR3]|uniref:hypothetical protein n=1 Tax=Sphingomonas sp. BGYR3 TaxID=2975483 RepID=UPI0021A4296F|nr:hypothetical protein [Sphingomonas sp. BGYR3]MDG5487489.1 hypothetical protein [Sphingomonas sp. BGYR3]